MLLSYSINQKFPEIFSFTTTRPEGFSAENYNSFNLSPFTGDKDEDFGRNLAKLSDEIGVFQENIVIPYQVHTDKIALIEADFLKMTPEEKSLYLNGVDALITQQKGICIGVTTADCVPVILFDPVHKATGIVHAGWKGTCAVLAVKTIEAMRKQFGTNPGVLHAVIGPSISGKVYNVGEEVRQAFHSQGLDTSKIFEQREDKLFLDLWKANCEQLVSSGMKSENIEISGHCTFTEEELFFSARRLGIKSGRIYTGIMIR